MADETPPHTEAAPENPPPAATPKAHHSAAPKPVRMRRQPDITIAGTDDAFNVSFTSFSMILLSFFIFLNSLAVPDDMRQRNVLGSLSRHFIRGIEPTTNTVTPVATTVDIPIPELAAGFPKLTFATKYSPLADAAEEANFRVVRGSERFVITLPGEDLFRSGDDQIRAEQVPSLRRIADLIKRYHLYLEVEGHTDNQPITTRRFPSNWELSVARAVSVLRLFLDAGVPAEQIAAAGKGAYQPLESNETEAGRAKNRRVELIVSETPPPGSHGGQP
ncbi:MAG: OmpA family protein [Bdellovibrionales bacterium]|nr:OmpA family protein [Bdellovibrionales bacterium]